jgi:predicted dithiol-disulfide oxidoreductase (DUF899 family)
MTAHRIASHKEWIADRKKLLLAEKRFTRLRDRLNEQRRDLPWESVEKEYVFAGPRGSVSLADLFDGRSQLIVYHAMFNPATATESTPYTKDAACQVCSFWMDEFDGITVHLKHRDVTLVAASRAPYRKIASYKKRMGWNFTWVSSGNTDFNLDYGASFDAEQVAAGKAPYNYVIQDPWFAEREGLSVFTKVGKRNVYHTYSTYARGIDMVNLAYQYLDLVPKGRDEGGKGLSWVRRHDEYDDE